MSAGSGNTPETYPDFHRLAAGLRAIVIDFDYYRTRKLLEPNWDGYTMPDGHDIINDDCDLTEANIVTSQHRTNPDMHRIVLDLDYGVTQQHSFTALGGTRLVLTRNPDTNRMFSLKYVIAALPPAKVRASGGTGVLNIDPHCDYALIPSSTPGHHHLILDTDLPRDKYMRLLKLMADCGLIEPGYARAAARRGWSAIRPPWIRKQTNTPASLST
jgi:hypothetical protein